MIVVLPVVKTGVPPPLLQLTVLVIVAILPQASIAMNVLTCERAQPLLVTDPSVEVTVGLPQPSVAVAEPSAVAISL